VANSSQVRAIVVDRADPKSLAVRPAQLAPAGPGEVTIRVTAISLNRGEVKRALTVTETGVRPGWDFVGVVERQSAQGGPEVGTRVVGLLPIGAWAERLHVPVGWIASLPDGVSDAQAAALPIAGLTSLHALRKGGLLLGRKVLVDGATGGVGHVVVQLAAASGASVYAHVRKEEHRSVVAEWCTGDVIVAPSIEGARPLGPFDLIVDSVGGSTLGSALTMLQIGGTCVTFGASEAAPVTFDNAAFFRLSGAKLYAMSLFEEIRRVGSAGGDLAWLVKLVDRKILQPRIAIEAPWTDVADVARQLVDRAFVGKAVLHVS
jgi:NADPH:quinone reductase-like Zn-dependent oxidoreductase